MKQFDITCKVSVLEWAELEENERQLVEAAKEATASSYAPYSKFSVGAAMRLADGEVFTGTNQENVSYPCGLCAERTSLFYAMAHKPKVPVAELAVAAKNKDGFLTSPITPCGACRQALLEYENIFQRKISIFLYGTNGVYKVEGVSSLLPLQFNSLE